MEIEPNNEGSGSVLFGRCSSNVEFTTSDLVWSQW